MRPSALSLTLLVSMLLGCAPRTTPPESSALPLRAAFSEAGVTWTVGGRACVARAPTFEAVCPVVGQVVDVAWSGGKAWAAVPLAGLVVTLDRAPQSLAVGAVAVLSAQAIYRQDGSALTYAGLPTEGVPGQPSAAVTGGDGTDYVVLGGQLIRVPDGQVLNPLGVAFVAASPLGVTVLPAPGTATAEGAYVLRGGHLERLDTSGKVRFSVPHPAGLVGLVGEQVVTVTPDGTVRRYQRDLAPVE